MERQYDYKNVDWKEVKKEWDNSAYPLFFELKIKHGENVLSFNVFWDSAKRLKFTIWINRRWEGLYSKDGNPNQKYLNKKIIMPCREVINVQKILDRKCRKMTDKQIIEYKGLKTSQYYTPTFDNIAQIKKMVTALE